MAPYIYLFIHTQYLANNPSLWFEFQFGQRLKTDMNIQIVLAHPLGCARVTFKTDLNVIISFTVQLGFTE